MVGLPLQAGHAGSATGVGSVYAANVQQETVRHRRPLSLRMLAHVLNDCEQKGRPIIQDWFGGHREHSLQRKVKTPFKNLEIIYLVVLLSNQCRA